MIFNTGRTIERLEDLSRATREMTSGSIFYHLIEATRRTQERTDDFSAWIRWVSPDPDDVCARIFSIDPYFYSLDEIRILLAEIFEEHFPSGKCS